MEPADAVRALGFDDRFVRMWEYYLALSEAGFATGISQDLQIVFEKRQRDRARPFVSNGVTQGKPTADRGPGQGWPTATIG